MRDRFIELAGKYEYDARMLRYDATMKAYSEVMPANYQRLKRTLKKDEKVFEAIEEIIRRQK